MRSSLETKLEKISKDEALIVIAELFETKLDYNQVRSFYQSYFKKVFCEKADRFGFGKSQETYIRRKGPRKAEGLAIVARCFLEEDLCAMVYQALDKKLQEQIYLLTWNGGMPLTEFNKRFKITPKQEEYRYSQLAEHFYMFFWFDDLRYTYDLERATIFLPNLIRTLFKRHLKKPADYNLSPKKEPQSCQFQQIYGQEAQIQTLCFQFIQQGELTYSKNGATMLKSSLKKMAKFAGISEFYEGRLKKFPYLKTWLTALMLECFIDELEGEAPLLRLKKMFDLYFSTADFPLLELLPFLKKGSDDYLFVGNEAHLEASASLKQLLRLLPVNGWVDYADLSRVCFFRDLNFFFISPSILRTDFYVSFRDRYWGERQYLTIGNLYKYFLNPFLKANLFLFAAFGLVDLTYDRPEDETRPNDDDTLSPYDNLRSVRLTDLGAYICGLEEAYKGKLEVLSTARVVPDEDGLFLTLTGDDKLKRFLLEKIAEPISPNRYKVSFASFLAGVENDAQVAERIDMFFEDLCQEPPPNWMVFFERVTERIDPIKVVSDWCVFKVEPDRELLSLLLKEPKLRPYLLKAENYHLLIRADKVNRAKKYLSDLGYVLPSMVRH